MASFVEGWLAADAIGTFFGAGLAARSEDYGRKLPTTLGVASVKVTDPEVARPVSAHGCAWLETAGATDILGKPLPGSGSV